MKSVQELRNQGGIVEDVICVIQRDEDATTRLEKEGLKLRALFSMGDLKKGIE